jgi:hypothetical protein
MSHPESDAYFIVTSITTDSMGVYKGILVVVKTEIMSASVGKLEVCVPGRSYHMGLITLQFLSGTLQVCHRNMTSCLYTNKGGSCKGVLIGIALYIKE